MAMLCDYRNDPNGVEEIVISASQFRQLYTFEQGMEAIKNAKIFDNKPIGLEFFEKRDLGIFINDFIKAYKSEVEKDDNIATFLAGVVMGKGSDFAIDKVQSDFIDVALPSNFANELFKKMSAYPNWEENTSQKTIVRKVLIHVDDKDCIDKIKNMMSTKDKKEQGTLAYAVFSNKNIDNEYRNKLFEQTMQNSTHLVSYFFNPTEEMRAYLQTMVSDIFSGKRDHWQSLKELSAINKTCPDLFENENIINTIKTMPEKELCNAVSMFEHFRIGAFHQKFDKDFAKELLDMVKETGYYQKLNDVLYEPTLKEHCMLEEIKNLQSRYDSVIEKESKEIESKNNDLSL